VNEFFGMFSSERANVIKAVDVVRSSPLIGPMIPVHGLLVDIETGKVEWLVNGYQTLDTRGASMNESVAAPATGWMR
jgi:carbonic anhydrase